MANPNLLPLLKTTKQIVKHHQELKIAKGEHFNIFSVLDIETRENKTHSAFLSELLSPDGRHLQGNIFLKLFLQIIAKELPEENAFEDLINKFVNCRETIITPEFSIGSNNFEDNTGGRIDIHIENGDNCISIENKINALDQYAQVKRYYNYKCGTNTVFYLTLKGEDPHPDSKLELISGKDFYNINYRDHIIQWLELCLREVPNLTSVREAINQYILLIQKLTLTLNTKESKDLDKIMLEYLEEAEYISNNFESMINRLHFDFRTAVQKLLLERLDSEKFSIKEGITVNRDYSQLWIKFKNSEDPYKFGIASFSGKGHLKGKLFVGFLDESIEKIKGLSDKRGIENQPWTYIHLILKEDQENKDIKEEINLRDKPILKILAQPENSSYKALLDQVVVQSQKFIEDLTEKLYSQNLKKVKIVNSEK